MSLKITKKKFSLIELLIAIGIIALLTALTIKGSGKMRERAAKLKLREQLFSIQLAVNNYKKDYGQFPQSSNSSKSGTGTESENVRPFKGIRESLLGSNPNNTTYINGDLVNPFQENPNSQSYDKFQFMIAFDYDESGVIGDEKGNSNSFKQKSNPTLTEEDLNQDVIIWVKDPFGGDDIRSW